MTARTIDRRTMMIGGAGIAAGVLGFALTSRVRDGDAFAARFGEWIPASFGPWRRHADGEIILPETDAAADPAYDQTLTRTYAAPGLPDVMLVIAHGGAQSTSWNVHRPETCYDAAGFTLAAAADARWPVGAGTTVPGRMLTVTRGGRTEQVGYWRRIADGFPATTGEERSLTLRRRLIGHAPDGALVRMSALGEDAAAARAAFDAFAPALLHASTAQARALLIGSLSRTVA